MADASAYADTRSIVDGWSMEATLPKAAEIETLATVIAPGTEVFLSTLPHVSLDQQIETARLVRANGFAPVLHVAARYFASRTELVGYLARAHREAGVDRVLVIAGDIEAPRGEFGSSLSLIRCGLLGDYGIRRIGLAGYPDGHPKIADAVLRRALDDKLEAARHAGHEVQIVTQFCFESDPVIAWLGDVRGRWPDVDVRIGLAGPTSAATLLKFAVRCGVKAQLDGFGHKLTAATRLVRTISPDALIDRLDAAPETHQGPGRTSLHLFSFGGFERTGRWATERAARRGSGAACPPTAAART